MNNNKNGLSKRELVNAYKALISDSTSLFEFQKALRNIGIEIIALSGPDNCPDVIISDQQISSPPQKKSK